MVVPRRLSPLKLAAGVNPSFVLKRTPVLVISLRDGFVWNDISYALVFGHARSGSASITFGLIKLTSGKSIVRANRSFDPAGISEGRPVVES